MMGDVELDLAAALGAEAEASFQVLSIYLPNKDRYGRTTNQREVGVGLAGADESLFFRIKTFD